MGRTCGQSQLPKLLDNDSGTRVWLLGRRYWIIDSEVEMVMHCSRVDAAVMLGIDEQNVGTARRELHKQWM